MEGIWPILFAFFDSNGRLDRGAMRAQVQAVLRWGAPGVAVLGVATEVGKLSVDERREIVCRAPGPGKLLVRWIAEKRGSSGASATTMEGLPAQYVELREDAGEPLFVLVVDDAALQAALASCGL